MDPVSPPLPAADVPLVLVRASWQLAPGAETPVFDTARNVAFPDVADLDLVRVGKLLRGVSVGSGLLLGCRAAGQQGNG